MVALSCLEVITSRHSSASFGLYSLSISSSMEMLLESSSRESQGVQGASEDGEAGLVDFFFVAFSLQHTTHFGKLQYEMRKAMGGRR